MYYIIIRWNFIIRNEKGRWWLDRRLNKPVSEILVILMKNIYFNAINLIGDLPLETSVGLVFFTRILMYLTINLTLIINRD